ncbi:MAG: hypothetical protein K2X27_00815 [Candidatus Obscuribacterales bacterium]|nr:hypothetical protein [Candidatus Obscuribacterales bacterium]
MPRFSSLLLLCLLFVCLQSSEGFSAEESPAELECLLDQLQNLISRYYPKADIKRKPGELHAGFDTRTFMIHHSLKTGEWQEAQAQEGPNKNGMICHIKSMKGPFQGAALVPQTFNERYFEDLLMAPYNKKLNCHLLSHLNYPDTCSAKFRSEYCALLNSFSSIERKAH